MNARFNIGWTLKWNVWVYFIFLFPTIHFQAQSHLFYLHGRIVELQGAHAVDQENGYGSYQYFAIIDSLAKGTNLVHSEIRPANTDIKAYAYKIVMQVDSLLKQGVQARHINILGASKGAKMAMEICKELKNKDLNFVFMAACYEDDSDVKSAWYGNILSIYESSDRALSCEKHLENRNGIQHYKEIKLNTGLKHGFIFKPLPEWIEPVLQWAKGNYQ